MAEEQDGLRKHSHIAFEREPEVEPERRRGGASATATKEVWSTTTCSCD